GVELKFLKNRAGLDVTYYDQKTEDVLLNLPIAGSTGWPYKYLNAATLTNKGVEIVLSATPVLLKDFRWDVTVNWSKNKNKITKLYPGVENVFLGGFENSSIRAVAGQDYGTIYGGYFAIDSTTGKKIIDNIRIVKINGPGDTTFNSNYGYPIVGNQLGVIGHTQPDWVGGATTSFTWKRLTLSGVFYTRHGGEIWNGTK